MPLRTITGTDANYEEENSTEIRAKVALFSGKSRELPTSFFLHRGLRFCQKILEQVDVQVIAEFLCGTVSSS